ncbi:diguanylate cyclase domain-containing protein [Magnetococcus sp. PR-3]|uniref:diguanylate cyclase domain-containing protein n=1 Tax=Magnetococcus sp. PR-3 TaxID=3120355 RepID=UPI002FCDEC90
MSQEQPSVLRLIWQTNYLRNLMLLCILAFVAIPVLERFWVYPQFVQSVLTDIEQEAQRLGGHLAHPLVESPLGIRKDRLPQNFLKTIDQFTKEFNLEKVKVFNSDGLIVYSTDAKDIGRINNKPYFTQQVAQGVPFTKLVRRQQASMEGSFQTKDVVETYVPIVKSGHFFGAFELYYNVSDRLLNLEQVVRRTSYAMLALIATLALLLFIVLLKAMGQMGQTAEKISKLGEREALLSRIVTHVQDALVVIDQQGQIVYWNRAAKRIFGYEETEVLGQPVHRLLAPLRFREQAERGFQQFQKSGQATMVVGRTVEIQGMCKGGKELPVEISANQFDYHGQSWVVATVRDISLRKEVEHHLKLSSSIMQYAKDGILVTDTNACIEMANPAMTELTGYSTEELLGQPTSLLNSGRHDHAFFARMWQTLLKSGSWSGELWNRHKEGEILPHWLSISDIKDQSGKRTHFVAIFTDIGQRKAAQANLEQLAFYDALTAIPNRILFKERLNQGIREAGRRDGILAVLFLDLDLFKQVNDSYGHDIGDRLLQEVAKRLQSLLRSEDTVARLGGDEFAIVLRQLAEAPDDVALVAQKIIDFLSMPFPIGPESCQIGASVGISFYPKHGTDSESLVKKADQAMYAAKNSGRNRYRFALVDKPPTP